MFLQYTRSSIGVSGDCDKLKMFNINPMATTKNVKKKEE